MEKGIVFSTNGTGTTGHPCAKEKKNWIYTDLTPSTKTNSSHRLGIRTSIQNIKNSQDSTIIKQPNFLNGKNRYLTKENIQKANKHMKRCSIVCVIRELQIKTRCYHTLIKWLKSKTTTTTHAGKDLEQQELSLIVGGNAK